MWHLAFSNNRRSARGFSLRVNSNLHVSATSWPFSHRFRSNTFKLSSVLLWKEFILVRSHILSCCSRVVWFLSILRIIIYRYHVFVHLTAEFWRTLYLDDIIMRLTQSAMQAISTFWPTGFSVCQFWNRFLSCDHSFKKCYIWKKITIWGQTKYSRIYSISHLYASMKQ